MSKLIIGSAGIAAALAMAAMSGPITVHIDEGSNTAPPEPPPVSETRQQRRARERALAKAARRRA